MPAIRLQNVAKVYKNNSYETVAIRNIDLTIEQGEFVFVVGSRAAGKSTLLDVLSGALKPDYGAVYLDEVDLATLGKKQYRQALSCISRIAQETELNRTESVYDNMATLERYRLFFKLKVLDTTLADKALGIVGMPDAGLLSPRDLTPAECKRVLLARAILNSPAVLVLDDFTLNADEDTIWDLIHLLNELNRRGTTVVMATNSSYVVNIMRKRVVTLADGRIVGDVKKGKYGYI